MDFSSLAFHAFLLGLISAVSLPIGAYLGILTKLSQRLTSSIMAYGAGALLCALTLELVAKALDKLHGVFWPIGIGCTIGGLSFVLLNQIVNQYGGFLRKTATLMKHITGLKRRRISKIIEHLSNVPLFNCLPPEEVHFLVSHVKERNFKKGIRIITEGESGFELYIVEKGNVEVLHQNQTVAILTTGEIFGEMALLTNQPRQATVIAKTDVQLLEVHKSDFDKLLEISPNLKQELEKIYDIHKDGLEKIKKKIDSKIWVEKVEKFTKENVYKPTPIEIHEVISKESSTQKGVALAIFIGTLLDGISESLVIGASIIGGTKVNLALIAGIFLSNFPESLSSSVGMKKIGMSNSKINLLWGSLCILTGICAYFGNVLLQKASVYTIAFFESLAAGAMLAMIAETMLPEAYEHAGFITGIATVLGFLSAIFIKTLE